MRNTTAGEWQKSNLWQRNGWLLIPCLVTSFHSFHSILFFSFFSYFSNPTIHPIPFYFFQPFLQLSKSLYKIFKSQPFIPHRNSQSQTILHHFSKLFSNHSKLFFKPFFSITRMEWNSQNELSKQRDSWKILIMAPNTKNGGSTNTYSWPLDGNLMVKIYITGIMKFSIMQSVKLEKLKRIKKKTKIKKCISMSVSITWKGVYYFSRCGIYFK